jgi:hypothetical protein
MVHRLMSVHCDTSDVARIGREAYLRPVRVHRWTYRVLSCAKLLSDASGGAFDVTLGREAASHADITLLPGDRVRLKRRAEIDLGGIAKGFAVDRAVAALRRSGARTGSVNAGGDLRIFGAVPQTVRVRIPASPWMTLPLATRNEGAFATSAGYFGAGPIDIPSGRRRGALLHDRGRPHQDRRVGRARSSSPRALSRAGFSRRSRRHALCGSRLACVSGSTPRRPCSGQAALRGSSRTTFLRTARIPRGLRRPR